MEPPKPYFNRPKDLASVPPKGPARSKPVQKSPHFRPQGKSVTYQLYETAATSQSALQRPVSHSKEKSMLETRHQAYFHSCANNDLSTSMLVPPAQGKTKDRDMSTSFAYCSSGKGETGCATRNTQMSKKASEKDGDIADGIEEGVNNTKRIAEMLGKQLGNKEPARAMRGGEDAKCGTGKQAKEVVVEAGVDYSREVSQLERALKRSIAESDEAKKLGVISAIFSRIIKLDRHFGPILNEIKHVYDSHLFKAETATSGDGSDSSSSPAYSQHHNEPSAKAKIEVEEVTAAEKMGPSESFCVGALNKSMVQGRSTLNSSVLPEPGSKGRLRVAIPRLDLSRIHNKFEGEKVVVAHSKAKSKCGAECILQEQNANNAPKGMAWTKNCGFGKKDRKLDMSMGPHMAQHSGIY